ncbi:MAG: site-specific integrase, partial [Pseudonocardiaceae bacterium]
DAIAPRYRALVVFDAYCGLRLGELAGLRRSRLDLPGHRVRVAEIAVEVQGRMTIGAPKTRAGQRTVPVPRFVAEAMRRHLSEYCDNQPDSLVFGGADGGILRANAWRSRHWCPAIRAAGLEPLRPHDLRHSSNIAHYQFRRGGEPEPDRRLGGPHLGGGSTGSLRPLVSGPRDRGS